jgi:hypothetical protein
MKKPAVSAVLSLFLLCGCKGGPAAVFEGEAIITASKTAGELGWIDLKAGEDQFFWLLQPWKDNKLATLDGWARFSEISFEGDKKFKITPLAEFPRMQIDRSLEVWPEADLMITNTNKMFHLFDSAAGTTKSFMPFMTFQHDEGTPVLLDPVEGLVAFIYVPFTGE